MGVRTHVSYPNRITACTTATYNLPTFILSDPSLLNIFVSHPHFFDTFGGSVLPLANRRQWTTTFVPSTGMKRPPSAVSHTSNKTRPICSSVSSTSNLLCFLSVPRQHITEVGCDQLGASCGTNIPHWGHQGWGWFPSFRMTMLSRGCWKAKFSRRFFGDDAVPWHPSTGHLNHARIAGNDTPYCSGFPFISRQSPPPLGVGALGWTHRAQIGVVAINGLRVTWPPGWLCTQGNGPSDGFSPYRRVPFTSRTKFRPLLTTRGGCDMASRLCSPSSPRWSGVLIGQRGMSGRWTLPEGGLSLVTQRVHHCRRKVPLGYEFTLTFPVRWTPGGGGTTVTQYNWYLIYVVVIVVFNAVGD